MIAATNLEAAATLGARDTPPLTYSRRFRHRNVPRFIARGSTNLIERTMADEPGEPIAKPGRRSILAPAHDDRRPLAIAAPKVHLSQADCMAAFDMLSASTGY